MKFPRKGHNHESQLAGGTERWNAKEKTMAERNNTFTITDIRTKNTRNIETVLWRAA